MTSALWLLRDTRGRESEFSGTEHAAATAAQHIATRDDVTVTYRRKLETELTLSEAPTARMKRP